MAFNMDKPTSELIASYMESKGIDGVTDYVVTAVNGVKAHLEEIDTRIKDTVKTRKFERLDNVCLSVMRLAVYEMFYDESVPVGVAVNEATELIKKYDDSLASFVNGNLRVIAKADDE